MPKYPDFPAHSWEEPDARTPLRRQPCGRRHKTKGHWHSRASFGKSRRFHTQLDKRPVIPWTTREASRVPFLHSRRGLTLRSQLWRDPAIGVRNGEEPWGSWLHSRWGPLPLHQKQWRPERPLPNPQYRDFSEAPLQIATGVCRGKIIPCWQPPTQRKLIPLFLGL